MMSPALNPGDCMKLSSFALCTLVLPLPLIAQPLTPTPRVSGRHILDRCGNILVLRGLEQNQTVNVNGGTIINGSWNAVVDHLNTTRANQMRIIMEDVGVSQTRQMVERAVSHNLIVEIHASIGFYAQNSVRQMVEANKSHLILGIFGEPGYDDRARWEQETMSALQQIRAWGYDSPVLIMGNLYGRDLVSVLEYGQTLVNADPLHQVIMGWQAYWGESNWYQSWYGLTFQQAMTQIASKNFPVQVGLTYNADDPADPIDYRLLMALTRQHGISTHFWDYYSRNPLDQNKLLTSSDSTGSDIEMTALGEIVLQSDPNSFWNINAPRACTGQTCYANCDGSTVAPVLSANDFQCFLGKFASGHSYANCDGSTSSPVLNANDFQCFVNRFAGGCL